MFEQTLFVSDVTELSTCLYAVDISAYFTEIYAQKWENKIPSQVW